MNTPSLDGASRSARLCELWERETLIETEWHELYTLVHERLRSASIPELKTLPESREHYIHDFFTQKALLNQRRPLQHANVLVGYFRLFLLDQIKPQAYKVPALLQTLDDAAGDILDQCPAPCALDDLDRLHEASGLDGAAVITSARRFLEGLDADSFAYLALHKCPDHGVALYRLASERQIASYHYKARKLGITRHKGATPSDYDSTLIGAWLTRDLNLLPLTEHAEEMLMAFNILCQEALRLQASREQESHP